MIPLAMFFIHVDLMDLLALGFLAFIFLMLILRGLFK